MAGWSLFWRPPVELGESLTVTADQFPIDQTHTNPKVELLAHTAIIILRTAFLLVIQTRISTEQRKTYA
jgi:hypothetical protein